MTIKTKYFGEYEVDEKVVFNFENGLFGFENKGSFALIPFDAENEASFLCLQSVEDRELAFVVFNPYYIDHEFDPKPVGEDLKALGIDEKTSVSFVVITVLRDKFEDSTVNMKCPVMINNDTRNAKQIILSEDYPMRRRLVPAEKAG